MSEVVAPLYRASAFARVMALPSLFTQRVVGVWPQVFGFNIHLRHCAIIFDPSVLYLLLHSFTLLHITVQIFYGFITPSYYYFIYQVGLYHTTHLLSFSFLSATTHYGHLVVAATFHSLLLPYFMGCLLIYDLLCVTSSHSCQFNPCYPHTYPSTLFALMLTWVLFSPLQHSVSIISLLYNYLFLQIFCGTICNTIIIHYHLYIIQLKYWRSLSTCFFPGCWRCRHASRSYCLSSRG